MRSLLLITVLTSAAHAAAVDFGGLYNGGVGIGSTFDRFNLVDSAQLEVDVPAGQIAASWSNQEGVAVFEAAGIIDAGEQLHAAVAWLAGEPLRVEVERWARPVDPQQLSLLAGERVGTRGLVGSGSFYELYPLPHGTPGVVNTRDLVSLDTEIGYAWNSALLIEGLAGAPIEAYLKVTLTSLTQPVPEPSGVALVLATLAMLAIVCRRQVRVR